MAALSACSYTKRSTSKGIATPKALQQSQRKMQFAANYMLLDGEGKGAGCANAVSRAVSSSLSSEAAAFRPGHCQKALTV